MDVFVVDNTSLPASFLVLPLIRIVTDFIEILLISYLKPQFFKFRKV